MLKIAVTTFYTNSYETLAAITIPPLQKWCDLHGYDLHINKISDTVSPHFIKTKDVRKLLDTYDIVMGIENDILITNLNYKIEDWLNEEQDIFLCKDINNFNSGSIILKSTERAKRLLDTINLNIEDFGDEQVFFEKYGHIYYGIIKVLPHPSINSIPYAYYYPSYGYLNYKIGEERDMPTGDQGCWQLGNFCCHLPGKSLNERIELFSIIKDFIIYG